jgi:hypothetical protein
MRGCLLGHCPELAVESARRAARQEPRRRATAITKGQSVGAKTQRERDYIDALAVMYADYEKVDHRIRIVAYSKAMEQLAALSE